MALTRIPARRIVRDAIVNQVYYGQRPLLDRLTERAPFPDDPQGEALQEVRRFTVA